MGDRYADVLKALQGIQRFDFIAAANRGSVPTALGGAPSKPAETEVSSTTGQKGKKTLSIVSSGSVIDLTGDSSS